MTKKIAVILTGCGFLDGSEIHESVLTLHSIRKHGFSYQCFAPNRNQHHTINHLTKQPNNQTRNILEESARIARCEVLPLEELKTEDFLAVILPGGFGVAKNLFTFAFDGEKATVYNDISNILNDFFNKKKLICGICIAPALIAKIFENSNITVTTGNEENCKNTISPFGVNYEVKNSTEICIDSQNNIVTTPAYMNDEPIENIATGINNLVQYIANSETTLNSQAS